jgi:phosphate transport system protein
VAEQGAVPAARGPRQGAASSRSNLDKDLDALVREVCALGALTGAALESALEALAAEAPSLCDPVIEGDDVVDERYLAIQREVLRLIALQAPVASDARLLIASMHIGLHLERIGDLAVNVAELTKLAAGLPRDPVVVRNLTEMGATALGMVREAMRAFAAQDADACLALARDDDTVDALNRAVLKRVLTIETPRGRHRWGVNMDEVARQLERAGDHAVDIAEQVWFTVTGELREFTRPAQVRGG